MLLFVTAVLLHSPVVYGLEGLSGVCSRVGCWGSRVWCNWYRAQAVSGAGSFHQPFRGPGAPSEEIWGRFGARQVPPGAPGNWLFPFQRGTERGGAGGAK